MVVGEILCSGIHHAATADVVGAIKNGLEQDGLGDLVLQITQDDSATVKRVARKIKRRPEFEKTEIYLSKIMRADDGDLRGLDYETDIVSAIDWRDFDPKDIAARIPDNAQAAESQLQRIKLADDGDELFVGEVVAANSETLAFDAAHAVRMISDIVLNPFVGMEIVGNLLKALKRRGFDDEKLGRLASLIIEELGKGLDAERTARAEKLFKDDGDVVQGTLILMSERKTKLPDYLADG